MTQNIQVLIDEAGDPGLVFNKRTSRFFSVSATICYSDPQEILEKVFAAVRKFCGESANSRRRDIKIGKFSKNPDWKNISFCEALSFEDIEITSVFVFKPGVEGASFANVLKRDHRYPLRLLFERVSWAIRQRCQNQNVQNPKISISVAERGTITEDDLKRYLNCLSKIKTQLSWQHFPKENVYLVPFKEDTPIHIADLVASGIHIAFEPHREFHTLDLRIAQLLAKRFFVYQKKDGKPAFESYGIKFFPCFDVVKNSQLLYNKNAQIIQNFKVLNAIALGRL